MKKWILCAILCGVPCVQAADKIVFACQNAQGKHIRVTEHAGKLRYQFGKPNRTELVFENKRTEAIARSPKWNGVGRNLWTNLVLQNDHFRYTLFSSMDRLSDEHPIEYGVTVEKIVGNDTKYINQIQCSKKHRIVANFPDEVLF